MVLDAEIQGTYTSPYTQTTTLPIANVEAGKRSKAKGDGGASEVDKTIYHGRLATIVEDVQNRKTY